MKSFLGIAALLVVFLEACVSAEQKEEKRWDVKVSRASEGRVWVAKSDGSKQCGEATGLSPEVEARKLKKAGILVFQFGTGSDGKMQIAMCGADTGRTVELEIPAADLAKVQAYGYTRKQRAQN